MKVDYWLLPVSAHFCLQSVVHTAAQSSHSSASSLPLVVLILSGSYMTLEDTQNGQPHLTTLQLHLLLVFAHSAPPRRDSTLQVGGMLSPYL